MAGRKLSMEEIYNLTRLDKNQRERLESHHRENFTKQDQLQILNAVSDLFELTEDNRWRIVYQKNNTRFFVRPNTSDMIGLPCGNFTIDRVMQRLEL